MDTSVAAVEGLIVSAEVLVLEKATASVVDPEIETWYAVGEVTTIELGIGKVTRRTVPVIVVTAVAATVVIGEPVAVGFSVTVTLEGKIVPEGKPEPVTFIFTPTWPDVGEVDELSKMGVSAQTG
jgi:hypothetical protein